MMGYELSNKHNILYSISHETNFGYVTKKENEYTVPNDYSVRNSTAEQWVT